MRGRKATFSSCSTWARRKTATASTPGIGEDDLLPVGRGGIALEGSLDVRLDEAADVREFAQKGVRDALRVFPRDRMHGEAFGQFAMQTLLEAAELQGRLLRKIVHRNLLLRDETGKDDVKQILCEGGNRHFRRQVFAAEVLDPPAMGVGFEQLVNETFHGMIHSGESVAEKARCCTRTNGFLRRRRLDYRG